MRTPIILLLFAPALPADAGIRDRFELPAENSKQYAEPRRYVLFDVTDTTASGRAADFRGFHDCGSTWRIRFMPDTLGQWGYRARFSDGSPGAANPLWFGYKNGAAELVRSLHAGGRISRPTGRTRSVRYSSTGPSGRAMTCSLSPATT